MIPRAQERVGGINRSTGPIQEPSEPQKYTEVEVEDYTFTFANGGSYTVTIFPEDAVHPAGEGENLHFVVFKPLETTRVYMRHLLMTTQMRRIQKIFEKPFKPGVIQDAAYLQAETAHPTLAP